MTFNPEVTFGHILTAVAVVTSILGVFWALRGRLDIYVDRFDRLERQHDKRMSLIEERHDQRITKLEDHARQMGDVLQQLVGRQEGYERWRGEERRRMPRHET